MQVHALDDLSTGRKLALVAGGALSAVLGLGVISFTRSTAIAELNEERSEIATMTSQLAELSRRDTELQLIQREALLATDQESRDAAGAHLSAQSDAVRALWQDIDPAALSSDVQRRVEVLRNEYDGYLATVQTDFVALLDADRSSTAAAELLRAEESATEAIEGSIGEAHRAADAEEQQLEHRLDGAIRTIRRSVVLAVAVAVAVVSALSVLVGRSITRPIAQIEAALRHVAESLDLRGRLELRGRNEFGRLAGSVNALLDASHHTLSTVNEQTTKLAVAAEELAVVSEHLATGTATINHSTDELAHAVRSVSMAAQQAASGGAETTGQADQAARRVAQLADSTGRIGDIVTAITVVADQTNLLALNATIEAARAGAAGQGFAVVAAEVKELALETARSTESIRSTLADIQSGSDLVVSAIEDIATSIGSVSESQLAIAGSVEQQTVATDTIALVVRESNASIAQASATANELAQMAAGLQESVARFIV